MQEFILIDWGTSSFRLWVLDSAGEVVNERHSQSGMSRIRPEDFEPLLEANLCELGVGTEVPVLICGMAGAAQGWQDAGYVDAPADLLSVPANAIRVRTQSDRDVRILPGIANRDPQVPDVMRGEETILLGALLAETGHQVYCLPGTHSKWVTLEESRLERFSTFMTGELFALLSEHSTLAHFLGTDQEVELERTVFVEAVARAYSDPEQISQLLFNLRAGPLVGGPSDPASLRATLSGLLIGVELAAMNGRAQDRVGLIADGIQSKAYGLAFQSVGIEYELLGGKRLVLAGLVKAAGEIWNGDNL